MAEIAVNLLLKKLVEWEGHQLLSDVRRDIRNIRTEFEISIKPFLKDADAKVDSDDGVKMWVKHVREVAHDMEDDLDEFILSRQQVADYSFIKRSLFKLLNLMVFEADIGTQMKDIKARVKDLSNRRDYLSSSSTSSTSREYDPRKDALFLEKYEVVGIDEPRNKLIDYLLEDDKRLLVVAVYGEGGLGKTTLVKKVYDSPMVDDRFTHKAWITVSKKFDFINSLREQLLGYDQATSSHQGFEGEKMKVNEKLRGRRYLVVLDDIWTFDAWLELNNALPNDNESGSRIIITTRSQNIADMCVHNFGHSYQLQHLSEADSWKLFCTKAFHSEDDPEQFRDISNRFLKKCNGLPLAIVAIGDLLFTKRLNQWDHVYQTLGLLIAGSRGSQLGVIHFVISLSYNDLPCHLKACFMYLCIHPEDHSINCSKLLRLWVAERFVESEPGMTMEETARSYVDELIQRSLVQIGHMDERRKVITCKIHDLMREFVIGKSRDQNFATVIAKEQQALQFSSGEDIITTLTESNTSQATTKYPGVHCFHFLSNNQVSSSQYCCNFFANI